MKCTHCQIALPNDLRICPKCGARQWRWLRSPLLWLAAGALIAIVLGPGSFTFGLIAWLLLALIAGLAPWREWIDYPVKPRNTETENGVSRPASNEPRRLTGVGLAALQAASEGGRSWFNLQRTRVMERLGASARRSSQPVAGGNGLLYVMSPDEIRAYDAASGEQRWRWSGNLVPGSPAITGDLVIVRTSDALIALDSSSGEQRWRQLLATAEPASTLSAGAPIPPLGAHTDLSGGFTPAIVEPAQARTVRRSVVYLEPSPERKGDVVLDEGVIVQITGEPNVIDNRVWYPVASTTFAGWIIARNLELLSR